jgi:four helix bundle protein
MEKKNPYQFNKPYDLRDRLFEYACAIVHLVQYLHSTGGVGRSLADQILRAGNSAGANYEEADDGASPADTRAKRRLSLRELKEALFRLRVLRATGYLTEEHDPVINETLELKRIMASLIRKTNPKQPPNSTTPQRPINAQLPTSKTPKT